MNVLILTHTFPKHPDDTTAAFMHPLVLGLKAMGDNVTVLTPFHPDLKPLSFPYNIVSYKYIWPDRFHVLGYSQTLRHGTHFRISSWILAPLLLIRGMIALLALTKKEKFDIVCAHWIVPNGIIAALVCTIRNIPFTITLPGSDVYVAQKNRLFSLLTRMAAQRAVIVCADSPQYLKELTKIHARPKKQMVIPYPVDLSTIYPSTDTTVLREKLSISADAQILVSVGRLIEKKGFLYAIRALPKILKRFPKVKFVIVGDGDMKAHLEREAVKLHVRQVVYFAGNIQREQIREYYSMADVIVVPSIKDSEGNIDDRPVALIEAMACSRAVVVSRLPGNAVTIEDGKSGILVPPKNSKAVARAVIKILKSRQLQHQLGREARRRVETKFSHVIIGKEYSKLFHSLLSH